MNAKQLANRLADLQQQAHTVTGDALADVVNEANGLLDQLAECVTVERVALYQRHAAWVDAFVVTEADIRAFSALQCVDDLKILEGD